MRKAFTLVELLVAIIIVSLIIGAAYVTYITILKGFARESKSMETQLEVATGLELIRLDIEHAGLGLGEDQPDLPVEYDSSNNTLIVRSVLNNTNLITNASGDPVFWSVVDCPGSGMTPTINSGDDISGLPSGTRLVFLGAASRAYAGDTSGSCPDSGIFVVFPYDPSVASGCSVQFCNIIRYSLSASQNLSDCNGNTRNLLRAVGNSQGMPLINCVSDIRFTFDIDTDGDGVIDIRDGSFNDLDIDGDTVISASEVREHLKVVNVYMLVQEGGFDRGFRFTDYVTCSGTPSDVRLSSSCVLANPTTGIELFLPVNYENYRWKVLKLSVVPLNL